MIEQAKKCKHLTTLADARCKADVPYRAVKQAGPRHALYPCFGECRNCDRYAAYSPEELTEQAQERRRQSDLRNRGLSVCCEAPLDESHIITAGRNVGHGPRYCSKCGKLAFIA